MARGHKGKAPLTKLVGKSTIIGRCRYDIPFLSRYLSHSYTRAPLCLNSFLHFIKSFLPKPNLLSVHQKVNFGTSSWHCCYLEQIQPEHKKHTIAPSLPPIPQDAYRSMGVPLLHLQQHGQQRPGVRHVCVNPSAP